MIAFNSLLLVSFPFSSCQENLFQFRRLDWTFSVHMSDKVFFPSAEKTLSTCMASKSESVLVLHFLLGLILEFFSCY